MENPNFMFGNINEAMDYIRRNDKSQPEQGPELLNLTPSMQYSEGLLRNPSVGEAVANLIGTMALNPDKFLGVEVSVTEQTNGTTYYNIKA